MTDNTTTTAPKKKISEMNDLEKLQLLKRDLIRISNNRKTKKKKAKELSNCIAEYEAVDQKIEEAYRAHARVSLTYKSRVDELQKQIDDENAGANDKKSNRVSTACVWIVVILALLATVLSFVDLSEIEFGIMAIISRIALICCFCSKLYDIRKDKKQSVVGSIVIGVIGAIFLIALYVRLEENAIVPVLDVLAAIVFVIMNSKARSYHPNIASLKRKMEKAAVADSRDMDKINKEIDAQLDEVKKNRYDDVDELMKLYAPINERIDAIKAELAELESTANKVFSRIKKNDVLVEADKEEALVERLIEWIENGTVSSIKEGLKKWDYEKEEARLADQDLNHVLALIAEDQDIKDTISSLESRIEASRERAEQNRETAREEIERFKSDVEEKFQ